MSIMVPRVVMGLGTSGNHLWAPEAGNTLHRKSTHCSMAGSPGMYVEVHTRAQGDPQATHSISSLAQ